MKEKHYEKREEREREKSIFYTDMTASYSQWKVKFLLQKNKNYYYYCSSDLYGDKVHVPYIGKEMILLFYYWQCSDKIRHFVLYSNHAQ